MMLRTLISRGNRQAKRRFGTIQWSRGHSLPGARSGSPDRARSGRHPEGPSCACPTCGLRDGRRWLPGAATGAVHCGSSSSPLACRLVSCACGEPGWPDRRSRISTGAHRPGEGAPVAPELERRRPYPQDPQVKRSANTELFRIGGSLSGPSQASNEVARIFRNQMTSPERTVGLGKIFEHP